MIELGLTRITRLLRNIPITWRALHVAGTNGKGTVCAYASAMLHASQTRCGRFTSPHLIDRWDCITIGEEPISPDLFYSIHADIEADNKAMKICATEFEILTAVAFEAFRRFQVEVGVVEVGLGGTLDATNVLQSPAATVITKIAHDHESYLGTSIEEIASQKAGIIKPHTLCLADGSNTPPVLDVLQKYARDCQASSLLFVPQDVPSPGEEFENWLSRQKYAPHQVMNVQLAFHAVGAILSMLGKDVPTTRLLTAIERTSWPGRLQTIDLKDIVYPARKVLLDGAHNPQAADTLGSYVDNRLRGTDSPVVWVLGISSGKDARQILHHLLRPHDCIVAVPFGPVDGMPWVKAMEPDAIVEIARSICPLQETLIGTQSVQSALQNAADIANDNLIVVAGSLYLVSEILQLKRQALDAVDTIS